MLHLVLHIVDSTLLHGPLIEYSAFSFESFNSILMNAIHGTYRVEHCISNAIPLKQYLLLRLRVMNEKSNDKVVLQTLHKLKVSLFQTYIC
jgi:hypothetical protein